MKYKCTGYIPRIFFSTGEVEKVKGDETEGVKEKEKSESESSDGSFDKAEKLDSAEKSEVPKRKDVLMMILWCVFSPRLILRLLMLQNN